MGRAGPGFDPIEAVVFKHKKVQCVQMYMYHFMLIVFLCACTLAGSSYATWSPLLGYKASFAVLEKIHQCFQGLLCLQGHVDTSSC